jgi:hypothetical protein
VGTGLVLSSLVLKRAQLAGEIEDMAKAIRPRVKE